MTIEFEKEKQPTDIVSLRKTVLDLYKEFYASGKVITPDTEFGGLRLELIGFNVEDETNKVNLGFLQVIFEDEGWRVAVPQNNLGKRTLHTLAEAIGRTVEDNDLVSITTKYSMFVAFFPYKKA